MDKYSIYFWKRARRDLEDIYHYIAVENMEPEIARGVMDKIRETITSLQHMPNRYREQKKGQYAGKGIRQVSVKRFVIFYKVNSKEKKVSIMTIRHEAGIQ